MRGIRKTLLRGSLRPRCDANRRQLPERRERKAFHAPAEDCGFDVLRGDQSLPQTMLRCLWVALSGLGILHGSATTGRPYPGKVWHGPELIPRTANAFLTPG